MNNIQLLDCTLRDGGYINDWHFGHEAICDMLSKLVAANVDIIECGYYSHTKKRDEDYTIFNSLKMLNYVLPPKSSKQTFAVMINYGECRLEEIPEADADSPVIRMCFHQKDIDGAFVFYHGLKERGYKIYVQPMASLNYSDLDFIRLIQRTNELNPECFYIVDSFGVLELRDFERLLALADKNLYPGILLGYHSHNNLQQAYGNAKHMVKQNLLHDIVIDASVYGMGRGAGNLNMELFATYLNREVGKNYIIEPFLEIIDEYLKPVFSKNFWGYSLPFYLSAKHNCHPNFAGYFSEKNTLSNKSLNELLSSILSEDKARYSEALAEKYYQDFQRNFIDDKLTLEELAVGLKDRHVLVLAPGKSIATEKDRVMDYIRGHHPIVIGINNAAVWYPYDYLMCVNEKRLAHLKCPDGVRLILSSNLDQSRDNALLINYSSYLADDSFVADNPVLMLLKLLHLIGINQVAIAGFDGYNAVAEDNYFVEGMAMGTPTSVKLRKNEAISKIISEMRSYMWIDFLTKSRYVK